MNRTLGVNLARIKFKNNNVVYENFVKCTVKDYEYNLSYNPTLLSGSQGQLVPYSGSADGNIIYYNSGSNYGILKDFVTGSISGSYFSPYVTTVGLYNDAGELLAVAKMASPMSLSSNTDVTFLIKWDTQWAPRPYFIPSITPTLSISVTPSVTPSISITPSISVTPSVTPSISVTPSVTPSISVTPSVTPSISVTPSVTPSISVTPSVTPSISATPSITPSITPSTIPAVLSFDGYQSGAYTFSLNRVLSDDILITAAPVFGYSGVSCGDAPTESDNFAGNTLTIPAGNTVGYISGTTPLGCSILNYRLSRITVNGLVRTNGQTITVGGETVQIFIDPPYACAAYTC